MKIHFIDEEGVIAAQSCNFPSANSVYSRPWKSVVCC